MLLIITSTSDELFWAMYLNDFKQFCTFKIGSVSDFLRSLAAVHTSRVNCDEMAKNRPGQRANRNC